MIEFYSKGGHRHDGVDPALAPLDLDQHEIGDLGAFLESLTGEADATYIAKPKLPESGETTPAPDPS